MSTNYLDEVHKHREKKSNNAKKTKYCFAIHKQKKHGLLKSIKTLQAAEIVQRCSQRRGSSSSKDVNFQVGSVCTRSILGAQNTQIPSCGSNLPFCTIGSLRCAAICLTSSLAFVDNISKIRILFSYFFGP